MRSEWIANYEGNEIKITNSWITGEKLFVNNVIQDDRLSFISCNSICLNSISLKDFLHTIEIYFGILGCLLL